MNKVVFERQTSQGMLSCQVRSQQLSQEDFVVEFFLDGKKINKNYHAGIALNILSVDFLKDKAFASELCSKLLEVGATAVWNGQVALYGDEPEQIQLALELAQKERAEEEALQLKETDIVVTKRLYNGSPAEAENERFSWFWGQSSTLKCKTTGAFIYQCQGMEENDLRAARKFYAELRLIKNAAEKAYAQSQLEKERVAREKRGENPWTKGLSHAEIKRKAKEWDDINNEGGEGFNPYYS